MASEPFPNPITNIQFLMGLTLPSNGALEALNSQSSLKDIEDLNSVLGMAQMNTGLGSDAMNSTGLENFSTLRSAVGHDTAAAGLILSSGSNFLSPGSANVEPYINLSSLPLYSIDNPMNDMSVDDILCHFCQGGQKDRKKQHFESGTSSVDYNGSILHNFPDAFSSRIKIEALTPVLKKSGLDINQENAGQQQHIIEELLLKELQDSNPQLAAMIEHHRLQNQFQQPILHSHQQRRVVPPQLTKQLPKRQIMSVLQDQVNDQQVASVPVLDSSICYERLRQYLCHLRSLINDNDIGSWKKFVYDYYAPGSKKRWCFSNYTCTELYAPGVFGHKSLEIWCCDICDSKSGKGLEANFDIFPRLLKTKFESGMIDEILFLDLPQVGRTSSGLILEFGRAVQESVFAKFHVVHEGRLRVTFGHDSKILSWEFCAQSHEEYMHRGLVVPQVKQMVMAAQNYQHDLLSNISKISFDDLQESYNRFAAAQNQVAHTMDVPPVNDLGYPKQFIRCLQLSEVVDSMRDLMALSEESKLGPIDCLKSYSQGRSKIDNPEKHRMELFSDAQRLPAFPGPSPGSYNTTADNATPVGSGNMGLVFSNLHQQLLMESSSIAPYRRKELDTTFIDHPNKSPGAMQLFSSLIRNEAPPACISPQLQSDQAFDKLLHEMTVARKGKRVQDIALGKSSKKAAQQSNVSGVTHSGAREGLHAAKTKAPSSENVPAAPVGISITVKAEPGSSERLPETRRSSGSKRQNSK